MFFWLCPFRPKVIKGKGKQPPRHTIRQNQLFMFPLHFAVLPSASSCRLSRDNSHRGSPKHNLKHAAEKQSSNTQATICFKSLHDPFFIFGLVKLTPAEVEHQNNQMFGLSVRSLRSRAFCLRPPDLELQPGQSTSKAANQPERQPSSKKSDKTANQ